MPIEKTGDPTDQEWHASGARFVPVSGVFGTEAIVPGPMTAGRPRPEPEAEHWKVAPSGGPDLPVASTPGPGEADAEPQPGGGDGTS